MTEMSDEAALAIFNREVGIDTDPGDETPENVDASLVDAPAAADPEPASDRPRNPDGTFAPAQPSWTIDPASLDDDTRAFLENNAGNDPVKALQIARDLQRTRRDHETEMERLKAIEDNLAALNAPEPVNPNDDAWAEFIENRPNEAAVWALQNQDAGVYEAAMEAWHDQSPRQAAAFERAVEREQLKQELAQQYAPVQQNLDAQQLGLALQQTSAAYPELADPNWIGQVLARPEARFAAMGLRSQDPAEKSEALRALGALGRGLGIGVSQEAVAAFTPQSQANGAASSAPPPPDPRQLAHVATAGYSPARETPNKADQHQALFRQLVGEDNFATD